MAVRDRFFENTKDFSETKIKKLTRNKIVLQRFVNDPRFPKLVSKVKNDDTFSKLVDHLEKTKDTGFYKFLDGFEKFVKDVPELSKNTGRSIDNLTDSLVELGCDPATGDFKFYEGLLGVKLENQFNIKLGRDESGFEDFIHIDENGKVTSYDAMLSGMESQFFDQEWKNGNIQNQFKDHSTYTDFTVIDVYKLDKNQINKLENFVEDLTEPINVIWIRKEIVQHSHNLMFSDMVAMRIFNQSSSFKSVVNAGSHLEWASV